MMFRALIVAGLLPLACVSVHPLHADWQVLAKTGDIAPGTLGEDSYQNFGYPVVAENGDVIITAILAGPNTNATNSTAFIRSTLDGEFSLVARRGMPLELARDSRLNEANLQGVTATGEIFVSGNISGSASDFVRAWLFREGKITELIRSLTPSGRGDGSQWRNFEGRVADTGLIAERLGLFTTDQDSDLDTGIWWSPDGSSTGSLLIREGDPLAGLAESLRLGEVGHVAVNRVGQIVIATDLRDTGAPDRPYSQQGNLLSYMPGTGWTEISGLFGTVPDIPGETFAEYSFPTVNDRGWIGFTAIEHQTSRISAWVYDPAAGLRRIASHNDQAGIAGQRGVIQLELPYQTNSQIAVDAKGKALLLAELLGAASPFGPHVILQSLPGDSAQIVAREGWLVPDRPGLRLGTAGQNLNDLFEFTLDDNGAVVFRSFVSPAPAEGIGSGLFVLDDTGAFTTLIAAGDQVEVAPGDVRVVQTAFMARDEHATALTGLANDGMLTLLATFTDNSQAILRTRLVPEPATGVQLAVVLGTFLLAQRKC
jgi:hypothetical protein